MTLHNDVARLRQQHGPMPDALQGVTKDRVKAVLRKLDLGENSNLVDCVFALLDNQTDSWFSKAPAGSKIADGASTGHIACHIGILQRDGSKLDREGRDYWIKPLREIYGIEAITLDGGNFIAGHPIAKSPNSAYRLEAGLKAILTAPDDQWPALIAIWSQADAARRRRAFQAQIADLARANVDTGHKDLIRASVEQYAPRFLPGFEVLYIDDADGARISEAERRRMAAAGVNLILEDAMPDALLWNHVTDYLWVIEAVTSDGEVDMHKVQAVKRMAARCGKSGVGFTTSYRTWKEAASRQGPHRNIAIDTYIWIQGDPAKQFKVEG